MKSILLTICLFPYALCIFGQSDTISANNKKPDKELYELSMKELQNLQVTSFSKKEERFQDVAAGVYVLTEWDIARSTATNLIQLLQMVPGFYYLNTVRSWPAYAIRESSDNFIGSVLVLVDGVVMQSWFTGAFTFGSFYIPLQNIKRIEIIRGPGGTLYGANAATGVINIITKKGMELNKAESWFSVGSNQFGWINYSAGTKLSKNSELSVYLEGQHFGGYDLLDQFDGDQVEVPVTEDPTKTIIIDNKFTEDVRDMQDLSAGFRFDNKINDKSSLMWNSHFTQNNFTDYSTKISSYFPRVDTSFVRDFNNWQWFTNLRYRKSTSKNNSYFIRSSYKSEGFQSMARGGVHLRMDIGDVEFQDNYRQGRNKFTVGTSLRMVGFNVTRNFTGGDLRFINANSDEYYYNLRLQDQIDFMNNKLSLTLGLKGEGWSLIQSEPEFSPNLRLAYKPNNALTFWASATRSITTPGFITTNVWLKQNEFPPAEFFIPGIIDDLINDGVDTADAIEQAPSLVPNFAGKDLVVVTVGTVDYTIYNDIELGFRGTLWEKLWFESNFYYTIVKGDIRLADVDINNTVEDPLDPSREIVPVIFRNSIDATIKGVETIIKFKQNSKYYVEFSHSYFKKHEEWIPEFSFLPDPNPIERPLTPVNVFRLRGGVDFAKSFAFSFDGFYASQFGNGVSYQYDNQIGDNGVSLFLDDIKQRTMLNVKLEKTISQKKIILFIWGRDILTGTKFVEHYNDLVVNFPRSVHRLWGIGIKLNLPQDEDDLDSNN